MAQVYTYRLSCTASYYFPDSFFSLHIGINGCLYLQQRLYKPEMFSLVSMWKPCGGEGVILKAHTYIGSREWKKCGTTCPRKSIAILTHTKKVWKLPAELTPKCIGEAPFTLSKTRGNCTGSSKSYVEAGGTPTRLKVRFLRIFQEIGWQKIGRESVALVNYVVIFITVIIIAMWLHSLQEAKHEIPLTLACVRAGKSLEQGKHLTPLDEQRPPQLTSFCKVSIQSHTSHEIFTSPSLIQIILAVPVLHGEYFNKCTCK